MIYGKNKKSWFTLIELIVTMSIVSVVVVSIIDVFILSTDMSMKTDINRNMQKNIKNVVETIAEDIRKNWVWSWVSASITDDCKLSNWSNNYLSWSKLCSGSWKKYFLAKQSNYSLMQNNSDCLDLKDPCIIVIKDWIEWTPLSNSSVIFTDLAFYVSNEKIPKVTISFKARPSIWKWVRSSLVQNSVISFQTTIAERYIKSY